jgi:hypothetical protein
MWKPVHDTGCKCCCSMSELAGRPRTTAVSGEDGFKKMLNDASVDALVIVLPAPVAPTVSCFSYSELHICWCSWKHIAGVCMFAYIGNRCYNSAGPLLHLPIVFFTIFCCASCSQCEEQTSCQKKIESCFLIVRIITPYVACKVMPCHKCHNCTNLQTHMRKS